MPRDQDRAVAPRRSQSRRRHQTPRLQLQRSLLAASRRSDRRSDRRSGGPGERGHSRSLEAEPRGRSGAARTSPPVPRPARGVQSRPSDRTLDRPPRTRAVGRSARAESVRSFSSSSQRPAPLSGFAACSSSGCSSRQPRQQLAATATGLKTTSRQPLVFPDPRPTRWRRPFGRRLRATPGPDLPRLGLPRCGHGRSLRLVALRTPERRSRCGSSRTRPGDSRGACRRQASVHPHRREGVSRHSRARRRRRSRPTVGPLVASVAGAGSRAREPRTTAVGEEIADILEIDPGPELGRAVDALTEAQVRGSCQDGGWGEAVVEGVVDGKRLKNTRRFRYLS